MRLILGIILGVGLMFGGSLVIVAILEAWGIVQPASFADGCLGVIIILLSILLVRGIGSRNSRGNEDSFRKW